MGEGQARVLVAHQVLRSRHQRPGDRKEEVGGLPGWIITRINVRFHQH